MRLSPSDGLCDALLVTCIIYTRVRPQRLLAVTDCFLVSLPAFDLALCQKGIWTVIKWDPHAGFFGKQREHSLFYARDLFGRRFSQRPGMLEHGTTSAPENWKHFFMTDFNIHF